MIEDITNPGSVDADSQGDGPLVVDQPVTVGPSSNPGPLTSADSQGDGPLVVDQPVTVGPSSNSGPLVGADSQGDGPLVVDQPVAVGPSQVGTLDVSAGEGSPQSPNTVEVTSNTVVSQVYGQGTPADVFV
jgi:hypothetical protein